MVYKNLFFPTLKISQTISLTSPAIVCRICHRFRELERVIIHEYTECDKTNMSVSKELCRVEEVGHGRFYFCRFRNSCLRIVIYEMLSHCEPASGHRTNGPWGVLFVRRFMVLSLLNSSCPYFNFADTSWWHLDVYEPNIPRQVHPSMLLNSKLSEHEIGFATSSLFSSLRMLILNEIRIANPWTPIVVSAGYKTVINVFRDCIS